MQIKTIVITVLLLILSNVFMTFAWYGHLKKLKDSPLLAAILISWLIASLEYAIQVPANRLGHTVLKVSQLKIIQEAVTLLVFVPFSLFYMQEKLSWNYALSALFMMLAVFFAFRD